LEAFAGLLIVGGSLLIFEGRSESFARYPTLSLDNVAGEYAFRFNDYAERLDIYGGSLLVPDVGGTLYYSNLRVYDLGGLTDRVIGRTLPDDRDSFYDYIFEDIRPTFVATHGGWSSLARFDDDSRFRRDYLPIREWLESDSIYSGDYVRRGAIDRNNIRILRNIIDEAPCC
jgi:hypothetical protein